MCCFYNCAMLCWPVAERFVVAFVVLFCRLLWQAAVQSCFASLLDSAEATRLFAYDGGKVFKFSI